MYDRARLHPLELAPEPPGALLVVNDDRCSLPLLP